MVKMATKLQLFHRLHNQLFNRRNLVYDLHNLTESPPTSVELHKEDALRLYRNMQLVRKLEDKVANLYRKQIIRGFCHLYTGQEACAVGISDAMRPQDSVITTYRCHGWAVMMGKEINETLARILSELSGKSTGFSRGKGGSMHLYTHRLYGGQAIVGAPGPIGTGIALAHKYKGDGGINFCVMGDAAVNQGQVHEAFNFAKLQTLPIVYVIENNLYGMGTHSHRGSANTDYYKRGDLIPGIRIEGNDVIAVREAAKYAIDHVNHEKGPILLELLTYRYSGHSMSDPGTTYRKRDEVEEYRKKRDSIKKFVHTILTSELVSQNELDDVKADIKKMINKALKTANASSEPKVEEVTYDVYKDYKGKVKLPGYGSFGLHKNTVEELLPEIKEATKI